MSDPKRRSSRLLTRVGMVALVLAVLAGGPAPTSAAQAGPPFVGTYSAVVKPYTIDPRTGARVDQPDITSLWNVFSSCMLSGCTAKIASGSQLGFTMVFDGTQWIRLAVPATGTCRGAPVPARFADVTLVPQSDGSLSGTLTSNVDCDGVAMGMPFPLSLTPSA